jgi:hypothetical protein
MLGDGFGKANLISFAFFGCKEMVEQAGIEQSSIQKI